MPTIWNIVETTRPETQGLPYSDVLLRLLALRGLQDTQSIRKFLTPSLDHLHDPFLMKGIGGAQKRILSAAARGETILIHGDYDVDGITGAAILSRTLEKLGAKFVTFLPERKRDGYGVSEEALKRAKRDGVSLFITVDCGITAFRETREARAGGMDVIIIDHHRIHEGATPEANVIINPLQEDCPYPFKDLSAGGLAFKLAQALIGKGAFEFLDLAALSCICDIAPLVGENRILTTFGLDQISSRHNTGFKNLCEVAGLKRQKLLASDLAFVLGPRINAMGRLSTPDKAFRLLTTHSPGEARELAQLLHQENQARQREDRQLLKQALQVVEREVHFNRDKVIVVSGDGWHEGVMGIVANRLVDRFGRPAIVITFDGAEGKGSGRSVKGFHLFESLSYCESTLEQFGGHELAAGFTIRKEKFQAFRIKLNEYAQKVAPEVFFRSVDIDFEVGLDTLDSKVLREIQFLEPFGSGNRRPVFLTRGLRTKGMLKPMASGKPRWLVTDGTQTFDAVWASRDQTVHFPESERYQMVYAPRLTHWDGIESVVLDVKDVKAES